MSPYYYILNVIRLEALTWKQLLHSKTPKLYVEAELESTIRATRAVESKGPVWDEFLSFSASDNTKQLGIVVKHKSRWSDPCVGVAQAKLSELLEKSANAAEGLPLEILSPKRRGKTTGRIYLNLQAVDITAAVSADIAAACFDIQRPGIVRSADVSNAPQTIEGLVDRQSDLYRAVEGLLGRLDKFAPIVNSLAEIHPFIKVARSLTSTIYNAVRNVFDADRKLVDLVRTMADAFEFAEDAQKLQDGATVLQKPIDRLFKQTIECCIFIRRYTSHRFAGRMLEADCAHKIDEFQESFTGFKSEIDSGVALHAAFVSARTTRTVDKLLLHQLLNPSQFDAFYRPSCLPGTRIDIKDKIIEWMFSETSQNIFWLHGVAGSGKSTVSTTIASYLRQMSRLGAFMFFEREKSEPSSVFRTIAYKLALYDSTIGSRIISEVTSDHDIIGASSVDQFKKLLLDPLNSVGPSTPGPVVIILDALDECGTPESRSQLMNLLQLEFAKLSNVFRFLITSRREADIDRLLSSNPDNILAVELDHSSASSQKDVISFLHTEMRSVLQGQVEIPVRWPWDENMGFLGRAANGLFIWASTAIRMVRNSDRPFYRLECLIEDSRSVAGFGLNKLYASGLRNSGIEWGNRQSRERFGRVMALVLLSKVPVSSNVIDGLLGLPTLDSSSQVLSRLRSLVGYGPGGTANLLHASFSDYLSSSDRASDPWFIDIVWAQQFIVERCFAIMEGKLQFDICGLQSSFLHNDDVPDIASRIKSRIPEHLEYACVHWIQHLVDLPHSSELLEMLAEFAYRRLLFWFEVLSLTKTFGHVAVQALTEASRWSEPRDSRVTSFLRDAGRLASIFSFPVMHSVPHIYTSVIPFSKEDSDVAAHYSKCMSSTIRVERIGVRRPTLCLKIFDGHTDGVNSIDFSPNGRSIASASWDGSVRVWNIDSGEETLRFEGSTACFSPDGRRTLSGSDDGTLRIWDAENGNLIVGPLEAHTRWVLSVAWSPDGSRIASGSADKTILICDSDGEVIFKLTGHIWSVTSIAFSPDNARLASGSGDGKIRIWDVNSGKPASEPLGYSDSSISVAFSPDGKYLVSGSSDRTAKIWEVESGCVALTLKALSMLVAYSPCGTRIALGSDTMIGIWDPKSGKIVSTLEGHTRSVSSVAFSQDGRYIASGSSDKTVRIWDAAVATNNSNTSTEHSGGIRSVAFSPDGRHIASALGDMSIIVWDAETGDAVFKLNGHTDHVSCVSFVPDGSRLISCSCDDTIRIWDAETGESLSEPVYVDGVMCIAVSPDGEMVASGSFDATVGMWSIETGQLIAGPLRRHLDSVSLVTFSRDGKRLASGSYDLTIIIWDTDCWEAMNKPLTGHFDIISSICFAPDSARMASGSLDGSIIIWDVESGEKVTGPFRGHASGVSSIIFSRDCRFIISSSSDNTIRVWNAAIVQTVCELEGHIKTVGSLALHPDGRHVASGSGDNTVRIWDLSDILQSSAELAAVAESPEWILGGNGWVFGGRDRRDLLAWIPPDLRGTLWRARNTAILNCDFSTKIEFKNAAIGERWTECFTESRP